MRLAAAMRARRTEFAMHDMLERFEYVAAVAMELDALASRIARLLYFP